MVELFANARQSIPLWLEAVDGRPDWDTIFSGYLSTTDYPACSYWRELAEYHPKAKVVLTTRDPDSWFDSVSETIFSPRMQDGLKGSPMETIMHGAIFRHFDGNVGDRDFMTDWYLRRNQEVIDTIAPDRLLVFHPKDGWEPLCTFLGVPTPDQGFPRVNSRDEIGAASDEAGGMPGDPEKIEAWAKNYMAELKAKAFAG